jgi:hypothetical protein
MADVKDNNQQTKKAEPGHGRVNPERIVETDGADAMERGSQLHRGYDRQVPGVPDVGGTTGSDEKR